MIIFLIFLTSEVLAKKIVLDCIGSPTLLIQKNEWDNSTDGEMAKVIIDTSKKTIKKANMLIDFEEDFKQESEMISARTREIAGLWYHISVKQNGTMEETYFVDDDVITITRYSCKEGKLLW